MRSHNHRRITPEACARAFYALLGVGVAFCGVLWAGVGATGGALTTIGFYGACGTMCAAGVALACAILTDWTGGNAGAGRAE